MAIPDLIAGPQGHLVLPPGRHPCTESELIQTFITGRPDEADRDEIYQDWWEFREQQKRTGLEVLKFWVDGGFASHKVGTKDIDFCSIFDGDCVPPDLAQADPWMEPGDRWQHEPAPAIGRPLRVDAFSIVKLGYADPGAVQYAALIRGWHDFWQRSKVTGDSAVKGYLEVTP